MVTVIIQAGDDPERLPALLAALTPAAVDGVVREVIIAGGGPPELLTVLRDETGAELAKDVGEAAARARSPWLLVMPAAIELKSGWIEALGRHLQGGGGPAVIAGEGRGWLRKAPEAALIGAEAARRLAQPDLQKIRRDLGRGRVRRLV
jgi:hypothetical protein